MPRKKDVPQFQFQVGDQVAHKTSPDQPWLVTARNLTDYGQTQLAWYCCTTVVGGEHLDECFDEVELSAYQASNLGGSVLTGGTEDLGSDSTSDSDTGDDEEASDDGATSAEPTETSDGGAA
jgi:hypothetical protein